MDSVALFCPIDDLCLDFEPLWQHRLLDAGEIRRKRSGALCVSEIMAIIVAFQLSGSRTFKDVFIKHVVQCWRPYFPTLVSDNRFVELMPSALIPLCCFLMTRRGHATEISFIDSTPRVICHNRRIASHKVFKTIATRGKTSVGWFYGFTLHLIINDRGALLAFSITPGNVDDRAPVPAMTKGMIGKLFGDRGDMSQTLVELLLENVVHLVTKLKKKMKNTLMPIMDKILLRKRALIETVNDQLKNMCHIEHSRHRSVKNFFVHVVAALIA